MTHWSTSYLSHLQTNAFTQIVLDYVNNDDKLKPLFAHNPSIENIEKAIAAKQKQQIDRTALVAGLQAQYQQIEMAELLQNNIIALANENTFTICTAHQPNIFTGPLYYVYKILHTVALCNYLKDKYPNYQFVPVYYMGSEDADIDEIGTFYMAGNTYKWQPNIGGAVGRIPTDSLQTILNDVCKYIDIKTPQGKKMFTVLQAAYHTNLTLAQATLVLVNALFGQYGVVVLEPDAICFKQQFIPIMQDELLHQSSNAIVEKTNNYIAQYYKPQAHSRAINLFYAIAHSKERIEKVGEFYKIINTDLQFTKQEILQELHQYPERFSANVILRAAYQETILPNIIFIGGGGEVAYWLQLKDIFTHHQLPYPMLVLRQSFSIVNAQTHMNLERLSMPIVDAFLPLHQLQKKWMQDNSDIKNFEAQQQLHQQLFDSYQTLLGSLPPAFATSVQAHQTKSISVQARLQTKFIAAFKKKESDRMMQLEKIHHAFFTNQTLQERKENMIPFYLENGDAFFAQILAAILPFGNQFCVLQEANL
jgi:bacillithiol synthase